MTYGPQYAGAALLLLHDDRTIQRPEACFAYANNILTKSF